MVSQPSPHKRFPGSFFGKRAKQSGKPVPPLQLDALENRTTPTLGWNSAWLSIPEPCPELSLIAPVNPHEHLDLVGEVGESELAGPHDEVSLDEDFLDEEELAALEALESDLEGEAEAAMEEVPAAQPTWSAPSIMVDMRREPRGESAEVSTVLDWFLKMELGRFGTVTVGARSFGASDPVFPSRLTQTSQFLIRPGLVTPMQNPVPEKAVRSSGQLAAWGVVMATSAAHLATTLPSRRRLTVESRPDY